MPLSEDEQRILRQIEEQLQRDPTFGRNIRSRPVGSKRMLVISSVLTVLFLAAAVLLLAVSPYAAFVAFIGAVGALVVAERHVAEAAEKGLGHLGESMRSRMTGRDGEH